MASPHQRSSSLSLLVENEELLLRARNVTYRWERRIVLHDVSLTIRAGDLIALRGANGSGKTTLLRCLCGLLRCHSGSIEWFDEPGPLPPKLRSRLAFAGHDTGLYSELTVWENLLFACRLYGLAHPQQVATRLLGQARLEHDQRRRAGELSRGMKQRLSLVRAFVAQPALVLLDEPFTALDAESQVWLTDYLQEQQQQGTAICFSSHDANLAQRLARQQWVLAGGRLHEELGGTVESASRVPECASPARRSA